MKLALLVEAVDARIGGVMIFGDCGTDKPAVARPLAATLRQIRAVDSYRFHLEALTIRPFFASIPCQGVMELIGQFTGMT